MLKLGGGVTHSLGCIIGLVAEAVTVEDSVIIIIQGENFVKSKVGS